MGEVSLWLTQKLNASMEEHEETSELRDGEDDHDIKNDDKLEGNSSSNCDFSYFKDKAFFLMFEDNGSHCKAEYSRNSPGGWGRGYSVNPWVGRCDPAPHTLVLFKTNSADFPTLFETEFRVLIPCLIKAFVV